MNLWGNRDVFISSQLGNLCLQFGFFSLEVFQVVLQGVEIKNWLSFSIGWS